MKTLVAFLVLALVVAGWVKWDNLRLTRALSESTRTVSQQKNELSAVYQALSALQTTARRNEREQVILRQRITAADLLANRRNNTITRLLNENEVLRRWYQSALPDDVIRLHTRPDFATPDDYLRWLSEGQQLPAARQQPDNQR
ncbi:Rz-like lysis system protein LysB [Serratia sp. 22264]|uniref:Rz-like lysis system protein LysB n=1 Tax=Serratia sp. 22264 TaxID=3453897 RepID=UPI003F87236D